MKHIILAFFLSLNVCSFAQNSSTDSLQNQKKTNTTQKLPSNLIHSFIPKIISLNYDQQTSRKLVFESKDGEEVKIELDYVQRIDVNAILPLFKIKKRHAFNLALRYQNLYTSPEKLTINDISYSTDANWKSGAVTTFGYAGQYKIKNKSLRIGSSILFLGENPFDIKRVSGLITANLTLKKSATSVFTVGIAGLINAKSTLPILPTIAYFKQISSKINLELILPALINTKYVHSANHYSNLGLRLDTFNPFFNLNEASINGFQNTPDLEFRNSDIKLYTNTQYHLTSNIWLSGEVGYAWQIQSRMIKKGDIPQNYILEANPNNRAYFNVGIFMRPKVTLELLKKMAGK